MDLRILTLLIAGVACRRWSVQDLEAMNLWRAYGQAGFSPDASLWGMDSGGYYMFIPGLPRYPKPQKIPWAKKKKWWKQASNRRKLNTEYFITGPEHKSFP